LLSTTAILLLLLNHRQSKGVAIGPVAGQADASGAGAGSSSSETPEALHALDAPEVKRAPEPLQEFDSSELRQAQGTDVMATALCVDRQNQLWVGTKLDGVRRYNPYAPTGGRWTKFDDVVGDVPVSSIAADARGRVWVGLEHGGVWVFDGQHWQNYDTVGGVPAAANGAGATGQSSKSGPLGDHIFKIAVCPTDGAVWLATDAGLSRYDDSASNWSYFTRADGLPSDATDAITFDKAGDAFVGTPCDGIAISEAAGGYRHWRTVTGPSQITTDASGEGLPSNNVNEMVTSTADVVYVATASGLAWSVDQGKSWRYQHGRTWIQQLADRPEGLSIYAAFVLGGVERLTCQTDGTPVKSPEFPLHGDQVFALCSDMTRFPVAGGFDDGAVLRGKAIMLEAHQPPAFPTGMPAEARPPTDAEIAALMPPDTTEAAAPIITMDDDWRTQGTWVGRYGRDWSALPGIPLPNGYSHYHWGAGAQITGESRYVGPRTGQYLNEKYDYDGPFYYNFSLYDSDPRFLEYPPVYFDSRLQQHLTTPEKDRFMGEINDGNHPKFWSPKLYEDVSIPSGGFVLSMYFCNNDGRKGGNAGRDYKIELRSGRGTATEGTPNSDLRFKAAVVPGPPVAQARVNKFDNGVWKRFYVKGPADISVSVDKLSRAGVKWSAIMLDQPDDMPSPYFGWQFSLPVLSTDTAAGKLAQALRDGAQKYPNWWAVNQTRAAVQLARWCEAQPKEGQNLVIASVADYQARLFDACESAQSGLDLRTARDIEKSLKYDPKWPDSSGQEARDLAAYVESVRKPKE
jgi:hypothetical protein